MNGLMTIIEMEEGQRTPAQQQAITAHERLVYDRQMVEIGLAGMCRDLKEIRDNKYYETLGFTDFGEYTEQAHGIGARQAYKYIRIYEKLGIEVLNSNSKIGVTKLLEIASLDKDERTELLSEHTADELAAMSTDEVKRLTEQVRKLEEQLSFLENAPKTQTVEAQPFDELQAKIREEIEEEIEVKLEAQFEEERDYFKQRIASLEISAARAVSDDELKKYRENAMKEAKAAANEEMKKLKAELKAAEDAAKKNSETAEKANKDRAEAERKVKEAEERAARATQLEAQVQAARAEKEAVEKQIRLSSDPELTRFKFLFETWQNATNAMIEQLGKLGEDKQTKMKQAIKAVTEGMGL